MWIIGDNKYAQKTKQSPSIPLNIGIVNTLGTRGGANCSPEM